MIRMEEEVGEKQELQKRVQDLQSELQFANTTRYEKDEKLRALL